MAIDDAAQDGVQEHSRIGADGCRSGLATRAR